MNAQRFDGFAQQLGHATLRRRVLFGLALSPFVGLVAPRRLDDVAARKKRKHKNRKPKTKQKAAAPNAFGCIDVGDLCQNATQCCSGICEGTKGKQTCRAHDTGTCSQDGPGLCTAPNGEVESCNGNGSCSCFRTTAGSNACVEVGHVDSTCSDCRTDADCLAMGLPPGSVCIPVTEGICDAYCQSNMACLAPCPSPALP
jgi:hypothetical protein